MKKVAPGASEAVERLRSLQSQIRDLQRSLGHSIDVAVQHVNTQKQALEVSNAKLRVAAWLKQNEIKRNILKNIMKFMKMMKLSCISSIFFV